MNKGYYTLFFYSPSGVKFFLSQDLKFYLATNSPMKFPSKQSAKQFLDDRNKRGAADITPIATQIFIQGPRGGIYRLNEA